MRCREAQKRLNKADWLYRNFKNDRDLIGHLDRCPQCAGLLRAELDIRAGFETVSMTKPDSEMTINSLRNLTEQADPRHESIFEKIRIYYATHTMRTAAVGLIVTVFAVLALVPFNFRDKVGYEISISGVDRTIALDSKGIVPLLDALGMEQDKAADLLDSLDKKEILLKVGECSETCHLKISDLKTEKDVQLIIKAIIELGCCEIDNVFPIFRDESSSLLRRATRKLFS